MNREKTNRWVLSLYDAVFNGEEHSSQEAAITGGKEDYDGEPFFVGRITDLKFAEEDVDSIGDDIIEKMADVLWDECGEVAESWEPTQEEREILNSMVAGVIMKWIKRHNMQPTCYGVEDVVRVNGAVRKKREIFSYINDNPELGGEE